MYRHDYIIRLIERFGAALIALRKRILGGQRDEAVVRREIAEIAQAAGLDLAVARTLDPQLLLSWLAPSGDPDPAKLWLMAELLYLEGLHARAVAAEGWRGDLSRALSLFDRLEPDWRPGDEFTRAAERATEIRALLSPTAVSD